MREFVRHHALSIAIFAIIFVVGGRILFVKAATIPPIITYQGKILDNGAAVTTTKAMAFLIFDAATDGNLVYTAAGTLTATSTINVTPSQGIFSVDLGGTGTNALTTSTFANYRNLYLEVIVAGNVLTPRKQLTSVPYAINSEYLSGFAATNTSSTAYIPVANDNGNFVFSGNSQSTRASGGIVYLNPSSTIANGTLFGVAVNNIEKFRIDANGNTFASGTLTMAGLATLNSGFLSTGSSTINSQLTVSGALNASSTLLVKTSLLVSPTAGTFDLGRFFVDVSGNVSASGTVRFSNLVSCDTIDTDASGLLSCGTDASGGGGGGGAVASAFSTSSLYVTDGLTTSTLRSDFFAIGTTTARRVGIFNVDSSGNTSASGTLTTFGTSTFRDLAQISGRIFNPKSVSVFTDSLGGVFTGNFIQGEYLYEVNYNNGTFQIFDISHPRSIVRLSTILTGEQNSSFTSPTDVAVQGNFAYILGSSDSVLEIMDISDPRYVKHVNTVIDGQNGFDLVNPQGIVVSGNYAYISTGDALEIIDISNPRGVRHVGKVNATTAGVGLMAKAIALSGKFVYMINDNNSQLLTFDVSDPKNPRLVSTFTVTGSPTVKGIFVQGKYAYVTGQGPNALSIIDISSSTLPVLASTLSHNAAGPLLFTPNQVFVSGNYAYVASGGSNALEIVDVSSSTAPAHVASLTNGTGGAALSTPYAVTVQGNYAYVTSQNGTINAIDVSGAVISNTNIGTAKISNLQIMNDAYFGGSISIRNGLFIGNGGLGMNGDFSMNAVTSTITATNTLSFSHRAYFLASSTQGNNFIFDATNTPASASTNYLLSVRNKGIARFSISTNGDVRATGAYFGSSATVGTPGAPGDLAESVDIAVDDTVSPGDVMVVDTNMLDTYRRSDGAYTTSIAGVISTNPTIVVGNGRTEKTAALAMVGRVPLHVIATNGSIRRGDMLVSSGMPGYAMLYDPVQVPPGSVVGIVGVALDDFVASGSTTGTIMALLKNGWMQTDSGAQVLSTNISSLTVSDNGNGNLTIPSNSQINFSGSSIVNVLEISSIDNKWHITPDGQFVGRLSTDNGDVALFAAVGTDSQYIISGSGELLNGQATIQFSTSSVAVLDPNSPIRIIITPIGDIETDGIKVVSRDAFGFVVREMHNGQSQATFDWVAIGKRKSLSDDQAAVEQNINQPSEATDPTVVEPAVNEAPQEQPVLSAGESVNEVPIVVEPAQEETEVAPIDGLVSDTISTQVDNAPSQTVEIPSSDSVNPQ